MRCERCVSGLAAALMALAAGSAWASHAREVRGPHPPLYRPDFATFAETLRREALARGISPETFERAMAGVRPDPEVLRALDEQPEFSRTIWDYLDRAVSAWRVRVGRDQLGLWARTLERIEARYGVDRHVLVAIWGLESAYGSEKGRRDVIRSLATLAFSGRRKRFGREQLLAALEIIQHGEAHARRLRGSWAGAMGHTQLIPTVYNAFAVDFDGDGHRDVWNTVSDALASTAGYLKKSGWQTGEPWMHEIALPADFDHALADISEWRPVYEWLGEGIERASGEAFDSWTRQAAVLLPAGASGPAFLVYRNFLAIKRYNPALAYALAVGHLADRLAGAGPIRGAWPRSDRALARAQREELQMLLTNAGFDTGGIDGLIGPKTRRALRAFQKAIGAPPDGYASRALLEHLRNGDRDAQARPQGTDDGSP